MYNAAGHLGTEDVVQRLAPLVKRIAHHLIGRLPANVLLDDLIQNGMLGLLDAIQRYETGFGAQFETYASQRIRGAMLDGLRDNDWLPRAVRRELRRVEAMVAELEQTHGRPPTEPELAQALQMTLAEYQQLLLDARGHQIVYFDDLVEAGDEEFLARHQVDDAADPLHALEAHDLRTQVVAGIEALPEREKLVMALYYEQDLNLREIGEVMGVTESRVCQLHSQAIARIRAGLSGTVQEKKKRGRRPR